MAAMMAAPSAVYAGSAGIVTGTSALSLRSCASVTCARLAVIPSGVQVSIDGSSGGWYHVSYNGALGYASAHFIANERRDGRCVRAGCHEAGEEAAADAGVFIVG
jgi:uncharacterized protein YraI